MNKPVKKTKRLESTPRDTSLVSPKLLADIGDALQAVKPYGSVEIYVQNNIVTQITARNIRKMSSTI